MSKLYVVSSTSKCNTLGVNLGHEKVLTIGYYRAGEDPKHAMGR
jgi:hypothetical protein